MRRASTPSRTATLSRTATYSRSPWGTKCSAQVSDQAGCANGDPRRAVRTSSAHSSRISDNDWKSRIAEIISRAPAELPIISHLGRISFELTGHDSPRARARPARTRACVARIGKTRTRFILWEDSCDRRPSCPPAITLSLRCSTFRCADVGTADVFDIHSGAQSPSREGIKSVMGILAFHKNARFPQEPAPS